MLISGVNPEVYRRGGRYSREIGDQFTALLLRARDQIDHRDPNAAIAALFNSIFSSLVLRTMYGPGFATPADDDEAFVSAMSTMAERYLFAPADS